MANLAEELDLVEEQIKKLNESQFIHRVENEKIKVRLSNTKLHYWYETDDNWLDVMLDSIILHQSLSDDYIVQVWSGKEMLFENNITKECFEKIKAVLDVD